MKITTLFPPATEIAFAINAGEEVVGVSHACDFPPPARERKAVTKARFEADQLSSAEIHRRKVEASRRFGSVFRLDETAMWSCQADVVITPGPSEFAPVSLHAVRAIAEGLNPRPELVILYPRHLDDVLDDLLRAGFATGHLGEARELADRMRERIAAVETAVRGARRRRVAFIQWLDPFCYGGYWVPQLIEILRGTDTLNTPGLPPGRFNWTDLRKQDPDVLVVGCEGFTIERTALERRLLTDRPGWWELRARRMGNIFFADGAYFTRPGPRLLEGLAALAWAIHPDRFPEPPPTILQRMED